eukprot:6192092-Pleurochrysis_carterae.AAC.2
MMIHTENVIKHTCEIWLIIDERRTERVDDDSTGPPVQCIRTTTQCRASPHRARTVNRGLRPDP